MRSHRLVLSIVMILVLGGCTVIKPGRWADLADSGKLSLGLGAGIAADIGFGSLAHPCIGSSVTRRVGHLERDFPAQWTQFEVCDPMLTVWYEDAGPHRFLASRFSMSGPFPDASVVRDTLARPLKFPRGSKGYSVDADRWLGIPNAQLDKQEKPYDLSKVTDLELGATFFVVSARAGLNPLEFIDFLLGFAGVDFMNDDP